MIRPGVLLAILFQMTVSTLVMADEMRPAYLEMRETGPDVFAVLWKVPASGGTQLDLHVRLPEICKAKAGQVKSIEAGAYLERWSVICEGGLKGREISIDGLISTVTDALAHITYRDGTSEVARLKPDAPVFMVAGAQSSLEVASTYFLLGVDHILSGIDHLLFILALMLLINNRWMLIKTITAFTLAHSITLAGSALGYFSLPQKPVEATIALSIAFVASELVKMRPDEKRLSESYPWAVAYAFGLLHGFGFAGALKEIGLPQIDVPLALLTFNIGVEAGQLIFVGAVLTGLKVVNTFITAQMASMRLTAAYLIGAISVMWLFERLSSFGT